MRLRPGNVRWHTHERYAHPPEARGVVHEDGWLWEREIFREHDRRGYGKDNSWTE